MSSIYNILSKFNSLLPNQEAKQNLTESASPKTKLEETMAKIESDLKTFKEGSTEDWIAAGGKVTQGKYHKPRKGEKWQGSAHIGKGDAGGKAGQQTGRGANVGSKGKPVVTAEAAAPGQEDWIKKNKARFIKQYGKDKGMEVLYATAWKRSKNEGAYDSEVSDEDPVFEDGDYGWDVKEPKSQASGTRKVAGTRYGGSAQKDDDEEDNDEKPTGEKRGRGRPKGTGKKMGAKGPTGKSKLMKNESIGAPQRSGYRDFCPYCEHETSFSDSGTCMDCGINQSEWPDEDDSYMGSWNGVDEARGDDYWDFKDLKDEPTSGTRKVAGKRYGGSAQVDEPEDDEDSKTPVKRGRGRPAGSGKKMGAKGPTGKSKLMKKGAIKEADNEGNDMVKLAKVIASCTTPEQLEVAKKMANNFLKKHRSDDDVFTAKAFKTDVARAAAVKRDIRDKSKSFMKESRPSLMDRLLDETYSNFGEAESDLTLDQDQLRQHIGDGNFEQLRQSMGTQGTFPDSMYDVLFDYFSNTGEMPYGAATAEDDDPYNWIQSKLDQMFPGEATDREDYGTFGDDERPEEDEMNAENVNESKQIVVEGIQQIVHSYPHETKRFVTTGEMDDDLYSALFDYYFNAGEMPYGTAKGRDGDPIEWVSMQFDQDLQDLQIEENSPDIIRRPVIPTAPAVPGPVAPVAPVGDDLGAELNELARLAGLKESYDISPLTQAGAQEPQSGMSINTNIDTRTGNKTMTVTADGDVADKLAEILSLSGLAGQVTARSSEVVGQEVEQEPEMQVVAVGEDKDPRYQASTTPDPEVASVDAIVDQGDDLNRKKKQHADKPKLGDNPLATEGLSLSKSLVRELESIKVKK